MAFKHFGTQEILSPGHISKGLVESPAFQRSEQTMTHCGISASDKEPNQSNQNEVYPFQPSFDSRIPWQHRITPFNIPLPLSDSTPFHERSNHAESVRPQFPHLSGATQIDQNTQQSSRHVQSFHNIPNPLPMNENNQQQPMTALPTTGVMEKVSSVVYCSRVIKDPRMHRHSSSNTSFDSEGNQTGSNTSRCESMEKPELKTVSGGSNEENKVGIKTNDKQSEEPPLANASYVSAVKCMPKKQQSHKMLRMKFKKYAAYLHLSKEERKKKIQSLQNFSSDQKRMLSERIDFYDIYFQKYKKGELIQNDNTAVDPAVSCKAGPEHICSSNKNVGQNDCIQSPVEVQQQASVCNSHNTSCHQNSNLSPKASHHETVFHNSVRVQGNPSSPLERNSEKMEQKDTQVSNQRDQWPIMLNFRNGHLSTDVLKSRLEKQDCNFDNLHIDQRLWTRSPGESEDSQHSEYRNITKIQTQEADQNDTSRDGRKFFEQSQSAIMTFVHTDSISQQLPSGSGEPLENNTETHAKIQAETVSPLVNSEREQQSTNQSSSLTAENPLDMITEGHMDLIEARPEVMVAGNTTFQDDVTVHCGISTKVIDMVLVSDLGGNVDSAPNSSVAIGNEMLLDSNCSMIVHECTADVIGACEEVYAMEISENTESTASPLVLLSLGQKREIKSNTIHQPQEMNPKTMGSMVSADGNGNSHQIHTGNSQIEDAIYIALCSRLQLGHLCLSNNENGLNSVSGKHYLKPKDINSPMDNSAPTLLSSNSTQVIKDKHHLFSVTINGDRDYSSVTEFPSLSKRFAVFGPPQDTYSSQPKERNDKMSNTLIKVLNSTTGVSDGLYTKNSINAKFIKKMAEKYNGKENSSFSKLSRKPQMSPEVEHSMSKTPHPEGSQTSNNTKTRHIEMSKKHSNLITKNRNLNNDPISTNIRRNTRNRKASNNFKSASSVHRISVSDSSRVAKTVAMKPRKGVIMKMMKDFRRSNSWGTFSHRFNSKRMQCQGKLSNGAARSNIQEEMLSETEELLGCGHSKSEELKLPHRELKTNLSAESGKEGVCALLQATDAVDKSSTSTIDIITEGSVEHIGRSKMNKLEHLKPTQETEALPQSIICNINTPRYTEECQVTHSSPGDKLPAITCTTLSNQCHESNESPTSLSKHKEDLSQETTKQVDKHSHEEVKETSASVTRTTAEESISVSEIMEYPLDTAIEILCGSGVESGSTVYLPYSADYDIVETERSVASEGSDPFVPLKADDKTSTSSKEIKLISRLRDFLTNFETTVKTDEAMDLLTETTGEDELHICGESQEARGMGQQSVELVVLDRAELPNMRQPVSNPMMKAYDKELVIPKLLELEQWVGGESEEVTVSNTNFTKVENSKVGTIDKEDERTSGNINNRDSIPCISPDSTSMLEIPKVSPNIPLDKSTIDVHCSEISTSVPDTKWAFTVENCETSASREQPISNSQTLNTSKVNTIMVQLQLGQSDISKPTEIPKPSNIPQSQDTSFFLKTFTVADISKILKEGDKTDSLIQLCSLRTNCKFMLHHFISNFERKQNVQANEVVTTRDLILQRYLELPPTPVDLKYEALNSFLELQMILETWQFIDNKMRYLSGHATFRSLLWYDPSLYGELLKGKEGLQQQSSLYTSFQQTLTHKDSSALQRYHSAVCMLHQQLQKTHELSYYMYLKSKRERLEVEAVLRNPAEVRSFFLSVPLSCMINLGDSVESLQRTLSLVSTFTETPANRLEGAFDIGKAENLAMMCRYLQEKISYLKAFNDPLLSKISWFGMEHLLYDASKVLVWRDSREPSVQALPVEFQTENSLIVHGKTETGASLAHASLLKGWPMGRAKISGHKRADQARGWKMPTEKKCCVQVSLLHFNNYIAAVG